MVRFVMIFSLCMFASPGIAKAEVTEPQSSVTTLEVPAPQNLSDADKKKIEDAVKSIYPNAELNFTPGEQSEFLGKGFFCKAVCAAAYTAAVVACSSLSGPLITVCMPAASQANEACLTRCN